MRHLYSCLDLDQIKEVMSFVPGGLQEVMKDYHLILAGGFIRDIIAGKTPNDIDLWCMDSDRCSMAAMLYVAKIGGDIGWGDFAGTVTQEGSFPVAFIYARPYATPEALIDSFDYSVCRAAIWWNGFFWESMVDVGFKRDIETRRLSYRDGRREEVDPDLVVQRLSKLIRKGYTPYWWSLEEMVLGWRSKKQGGGDD